MSVARLVAAVTVVAAVLAAVAAPVGAQQAPGVGTDSVPEVAEQLPATAASAPVLGAAFLLEGEWVASGVVWLDWDDVDDAAGYELMYRSAHGWILLADHEAAAGVVVAFEGSSARVVGLQTSVSEHWFAVRARNVQGVSGWSESVGVAVPAYAQADPAGTALFDPFTAPTRSGIDLERLREALATIAPGRADCSMVSALDVAGISVVDPPADLNDADAELTVAEMVRVAGGCLVVEHVALAGRTVDEVREMLRAEPSVHAVGEPIRGVRVAHPGTAYSDHTGGDDDVNAHYSYGNEVVWHLAQPTMNALWDGWQVAAPVTVAVLDTGVDSSHPDLDDQIVTDGLAACHRVDLHGHGTHVAGIVAGEHDRRPGAVNGHGAGVAPDARVLSVRVLERDTCDATIGPTEAVAAAVNNGARVINMSLIWGSGERSDQDQQVGGIPIDRDVTSDTFELAVRAASMLGVVSVAAAGNCGSDEDVTIGGETKKSWEWNKCSGHNFDHAPAIYARTGDVITVAAVERNAQRRTSSTVKDFVDIAAPGGAILSTVPLSACDAEDTDGDDVDDKWTPLECGTGTPLTECPDSEPRRIRSTDDPPASGCAHRVFEKSGTSMASPFVAGVVAHMLNRHPDADVGDIRLALARSARRDLDIDFPNFSYGFGIVDPAEAVAMLGEIVPGDVAADAGGFAAVAAGGRFSCGLRSSGRVRCWGQSGVVANTPGLAFDEVSAPTGPADHACGINMSSLEPGGPRYGTALCWSATGAGVPRVVEGTLDQVVTGFAQSCGLRSNKRVVCWDNDTAAGRYQSDVDGEAFVEISGGWLHFCGRRGDNSVACWGSDTDGQTDVPAGVKFRAVDAGGESTCGVTVDGVIRCWGRQSSLPTPGRPSEASTELGQNWVYGWSGDLWGGSYRLVRCDPDGDPCYSSGSNWHFGYRGDSINDRRWSAAEGRWLHLDGQYVRIPLASDTAFKVLNVPAYDREAYVLWDTGIKAATAFPQYGLNGAGGPASRYVAVDVGHAHSCAIRLSSPGPLFHAHGGTVECWGDNAFGRTDAPAGGFTAVSAGRDHSCGLRPDATVRCWGDDSSGQAPQASLASLSLMSLGGTELISFDPDVTEYAVGSEAGFATLAWTVADDATSGPSDDPTPDDANPSTAGHQIKLVGGSVIEVTVKALFGLGEVRTYRINVVGLGLTSLSVSPGVPGPNCQPTCPQLALTPAFAPDVTSYRAVAPAGLAKVTVAHTAAGGAAVALPGDADTTTAGHQISLRAGGFASVDAGWTHSCGLGTDGTIECWGDNDNGEADAPAGAFTSVTSGGYHSCGQSTQGVWSCWGWNQAGQTNVPAGSFSTVDAGILHNCGVKTDGTVQCWGWNYFGQTGAPAGVFSAVAAGSGHSCGLKPDGTVECWGYNASGQTNVPTASFNSVSAGWSHSCGLKTDNTVERWGHNEHGQSNEPSGQFSSVSAGWHHSCGLKPGGTVACWGRNDDSQSDPPSGQFSSVAAGRYHSCGLRTDGTVHCWGAPSRLLVAEGPFTVEVTVTSTADPAASITYRVTIEREAQPASSAQQSTRAPDAGSDALLGRAGFKPAASGSDNPNKGASAVSVGANSSDAGAARTDTPTTSSETADGSGDSAPACPDASGGPPAATTVRIPDGTLRAAIEHELSKAPGETITGADMANLTSLSLSEAHTGQRVMDLTGLEHAVNLMSLNLYGHNVSTLSPLPCLYTLRTLILARNQITSLAPLSGLTSLESLLAYDNQIRDLTPLSGLSRLKTLYLDHNDISDISPLSSLGSLTTLSLGDNGITGIATLSGLTSLETLYVFDNDITDARPLSALTRLGTLWVDGNDLADPFQLSRLSSLGYLDARHNLISDIAPLDVLGGTVHTEPQRTATLRVVDASLRAALLAILGKDTGEPLSAAEIATIERLQRAGPASDPAPIADLSGLEHATALRVLRLRNNNIADIGPISGLSGLVELDLHTNEFRDLPQLRGLGSLRTLSLVDNKITSLEDLPPLSALESLFLDLNHIRDLTPLTPLTTLVHLGLFGNSISDISPLAGLTGLESLSLSLNNIGDISPLSGLGALKYLRLEHTHTTDLEALKALTAMRFLHLGNNQITSLEPLAGLTGLWTLDVQNNHITSLEPLAGLITLRNLYLQGNNITDLTPLAGLTGLRRLHLGDNHITDFTPLDGIPNLAIQGRNQQNPSN